MLNKIIFILTALFCYANAHAAYPSGDYNFTCTAQNSSGKVILKIESGVDPSGGFSTDITASGPYNKLNGIGYMAENTSGPNGFTDSFESAPYVKPKITIYVNWLKEVRPGFYHGMIKQRNFNNNKPVILLCSYEDQ